MTKRKYPELDKMDANPSNAVFHAAFAIFLGMVLGVIVYLVWL